MYVEHIKDPIIVSPISIKSSKIDFEWSVAQLIENENVASLYDRRRGCELYLATLYFSDFCHKYLEQSTLGRGLVVSVNSW